MNTPIVWLIAALLIAGGTWLGAYAIKKNTQINEARKEGIAIGTGEAAWKTLQAANETVAAERAAEAETPVNPDKAALIEICKRSASCTHRSKYR